MARKSLAPNPSRSRTGFHSGAVLLLAFLGAIAPFVTGPRASADPAALSEAPVKGEIQGDAAVKDIATTFDENGSVVVDARGLNFLGEGLREAIQSGMEATVEYEVEIERQRGLWFDETVAAVAFRRTLKYDTLKKEYRVTTEGAADKAEVIQDLETARSRVETLHGIVLPKVKHPDPEASYFLRVRARLDSDDLAFPGVIRRVLFFAPEWGFDTGWVYKSVKF